MCHLLGPAAFMPLSSHSSTATKISTATAAANFTLNCFLFGVFQQFASFTVAILPPSVLSAHSPNGLQHKALFWIRILLHDLVFRVIISFMLIFPDSAASFRLIPSSSSSPHALLHYIRTFRGLPLSLLPGSCHVSSLHVSKQSQPCISNVVSTGS